MKIKDFDKKVLGCIDLLGMNPDEAIDFVKEFPQTAIWALKNAKGRKYKNANYENKKDRERQTNLFTGITEPQKRSDRTHRNTENDGTGDEYGNYLLRKKGN